MAQKDFSQISERAIEKLLDGYDTDLYGRSELVPHLAKRENDAFLRGWRTALGRKNGPKQKAPRRSRSAQ